MAERDRQTDERTGPDEGFLQRWSRRKSEARSVAITPAEDPAVDAEGQTAQDEPAPVDPEALPDIESLGANSDFSVFMRPGVPEHLRILALRKMWRADPIYSKIDGLLEYGEDYSIQSWPKGAIATVYRIGRGLVNELEELGGAQMPAETAEPGSPPAADAEAASAPVRPDEPVKAGGDTAESGAESAKEAIKPQSPAASDPTKPRRRPLPRRG